jgi:hypothetical protein
MEPERPVLRIRTPRPDPSEELEEGTFDFAAAGLASYDLDTRAESILLCRLAVIFLLLLFLWLLWG